MDKKSIVIIGGGIQQIRAIELAKQCGYFVIVTDKSPNAHCFKYADECVIADGEDPESIIAYILANKDRLNISGVLSLVNLTTTASIVANACGLPGIPISAAVAGQNKALMKKIFKENNIPTPDFVEVFDENAAVEAFKAFGSKAFIKPATSFGGQGTQFVESEAEIRNLFRLAKQYSRYSGVLIEEYVCGEYHDVNGIYNNKSLIPCGIVDSFFVTEYPLGTPISPIENYVHCPSKLPNEKQQQLYELLEKATKALGIDWGPVGADAIITDRGPMLIEIAPRLHGAANSLWMIPTALGIEPVKAVIQTAVNDPVKAEELNFKKNNVCLNELILPQPGIIHEVHGIEEAKAIEGVVKIYLHKKAGDRIESYANSTMIPCSIFASGENTKSAKEALEEAKKTIKFEMQ